MPFRLQDARRELDENGDFTIEALHLLRKAEDERRELLGQCREVRNQLILEDEESNSSPDEITTDSGKASFESSESSDSNRSTPERDPQNRLRKTNLHTRNNEILDLSQIDNEEGVTQPRKTSSVTFCNEPDLVLHLDTTNNPHRPNSFSQKLFCNPYGPPLYPRQRFSKDSLVKKKRRAKRTQKMITIKVAQDLEHDKRHLRSKRSSSFSAKLDNFQR